MIIAIAAYAFVASALLLLCHTARFTHTLLLALFWPAIACIGLLVVGLIICLDAPIRPAADDYWRY
jgi:hypothetical protein